MGPAGKIRVDQPIIRFAVCPGLISGSGKIGHKPRTASHPGELSKGLLHRPKSIPVFRCAHKNQTVDDIDSSPAKALLPAGVTDDDPAIPVRSLCFMRRKKCLHGGKTHQTRIPVPRPTTRGSAHSAPACAAVSQTASTWCRLAVLFHHCPPAVIMRRDAGTRLDGRAS